MKHINQTLNSFKDQIDNNLSKNENILSKVEGLAVSQTKAEGLASSLNLSLSKVEAGLMKVNKNIQILAICSLISNFLILLLILIQWLYSNDVSILSDNNQFNEIKRIIQASIVEIKENDDLSVS